MTLKMKSAIGGWTLLACASCGDVGLKPKGPITIDPIKIETDPLAYHKLLAMYEAARDDAEKAKVGQEMSQAEEIGPMVSYGCGVWNGDGSIEVVLEHNGEERSLLSKACGDLGTTTNGTFRFSKYLTEPGVWEIRVNATIGSSPTWVYSYEVNVMGQVCEYEARKNHSDSVASEPRRPQCDFRIECDRDGASPSEWGACHRR